MKIKFWGTRGSIAVPGMETTRFGGNTTCLELTLESGRKVVVDAGTGIRPLGEKLRKAGSRVEILLLITHIHWDHILGFPFFAPIYDPSTRISIDGYPSCMTGLRSTFDNRMGDGFFPIRFNDLKAEIRYLGRLSRGPLEVDGTLIESVPLHHPQGGFGFRFREGGRTLVFITDNELTEDAPTGVKPEDYVAFCRDADILIHDAQYAPEEIGDRKGWGHSDYAAAVDLARQARVGRLVLSHHDPSRTDAEVEAIEARCKALVKEAEAPLRVQAARENSELTL